MIPRHSAMVVSWLALVVLVPGLVLASWTEDEPEPPWIGAPESEGIVFFAYQSPPSIERYSLSQRRWLDTIVLDDIPTALAADVDGLYVSFGRRTSRFTRLGEDETHLRNSNYDVEALIVVGDVLYIYDGVDLQSVDKSDGAPIDNSERYYYWWSMGGFSVAPSLGYLFARSVGVSPSDLMRVAVSIEGTIGNQEDGYYHGDYPDASLTFVFPDESRVADDSGTVYDTRSLRYAGSFGGRFSDLTFDGGFAYIIRDGTIISYTDRLLRSADHTPENRPLKILVSGEDIISFYQGSDAVEAEALPLSLLAPQEPGEVIDPAYLQYEPDELVVTADETVLLLSTINRNVFRWSVEENMYLPSIPLFGGAVEMAYSEVNRKLYLGYGNSEITQIPLDEAEVGAESPFVNTANPPSEVCAVNEYLFVVSPLDGWNNNNYTTYQLDGTLISQEDLESWAQEFVWNEATRRLYFIDSWPALIWREITTDGVISDSAESNYDTPNGMINPVRVRDDGELVVVGSGRIFDGPTLDQVDTLSNDIADAVWIDDQLFTLREVDAGSQLQRWSTNYGVEAARDISGEPIRLFALGSELLVVTLWDGRPSFMVWNQSLNAVGIPVGMTDGRANAVVADRLEYTITISNLSDTPRSGVNVQSYLSAHLGGATWTCAPSTGSSCTAGPSGGDIIDIIDLAAEGEVVYTLSAQVSASAAGGEVLSRVDVWHTGGRTVYRGEDATTVATWRLRRGSSSGRRIP